MNFVVNMKFQSLTHHNGNMIHLFVFYWMILSQYDSEIKKSPILNYYFNISRHSSCFVHTFKTILCTNDCTQKKTVIMGCYYETNISKRY